MARVPSPSARWLWSAFPLIALSACVPSVIGPTTFSAQYVPQGAAYDAVPACAAYRVLGTADLRSQRSSVGFRFLESAPTVRHSISLRGELTAPLAQAAQAAFRRAVLNSSSASPVDIRLGIASIELEEKAYRNSSYSIGVVLDAQVVASGTEQVLWSTRKSGHGSNYGESGLALNYQETLSRGFEDALAKLLSDAEFSRALCQPSPIVAPVPAQAK